MANIWEKVISTFAGNLNSGLSYLITTVLGSVMILSRLTLAYQVTSSNHLSSSFLLPK